MRKPKTTTEKNKGGRPSKKPPEIHDGETAARRFVAGMRFAIAGGPQPPEKPA